MSELRATPGPWQRSLSKETGGSFIEHIDSQYVSHIVAFVHASHGMFDPPIPTKEDEANAHLIAAAPELYEALVALMDLESRDRVMPAGPEWDSARAALAKARGET